MAQGLSLKIDNRLEVTVDSHTRCFGCISAQCRNSCGTPPENQKKEGALAGSWHAGCLAPSSHASHDDTKHFRLQNSPKPAVPPSTQTQCKMPSRKSNASDATLSSSSRRSSLRRLSSIASFQNLFTRRRSQKVTENHTAVSSSSDLSASASSSSVDTTLKLFGPNSSLPNNDQDQLGELPAAPPPTHSNNRRSSYICLPDDPIGGMPRSRTFSNLPVPTRVKKTPAISVGSSSHNRLPSDIWPSTRLPSPSASTRKHSHSRLISGPPTRMKRSDTEPLLGLERGYNTASLPRSTAFKENISLSPIKPLPALDMGYQEKHHQHSSSPHHPSQYQPPGAWISSPSDGVDALSCSLPSTASYSPKPPPPISKYASHPAIQMVRDYKSSPARPPYRSSRDRPPTPGASSLNAAPQRQPTQRWNSQPVLTARPNNHEHPPRKDSKYHKVRSSSSHSSSCSYAKTRADTPSVLEQEIRPTRLLSAKQAPTPQPPKTPIGTKAAIAVGNKVKDPTSEQTPTQSHHTASKSPRQITSYEPPAYWAGRLTALTDRYRNEELSSFLLPNSKSASSSSTTLTPKAQTDKFHTAEASTVRLKRALTELESRCAPSGAREAGARESLYAFQSQYAQMMNLPELRPPKLVLHLGNGDGGGDGAGMDGAAAPAAEAGLGDVRKASFMDRLLGRQGKRRSLVAG